MASLLSDVWYCPRCDTFTFLDKDIAYYRCAACKRNCRKPSPNDLTAAKERLLRKARDRVYDLTQKRRNIEGAKP